MPLWLQILLALNSLTIPLLAMGFVVSLYWQPITARAGKVAGVFSPLAKYRQLLIGVLIGAVGVWAGQALGGGLPSWSWPGWLHVPVIFGPVEPAPITGDGLMVLMVEETDARKNYTPAQIDVLHSTADGSIRAYCEVKCKKIDNLPAVRVIDKDQLGKLDMEQPWVQEAAKAVDTSKLPFLVASNGKSGPKMQIVDTPSTLAALQKIGGK